MTERYRLPKSEILRGYRSYGAVLSKRKYVASHGIRCYYSCLASIPPYRCTVGFAVRNPPGAVERNRCKRLLREAWRRQRHGLQQACGETLLSLQCVLLATAEKPRAGDSRRYENAVHDITTELTGILRAWDASPRSSSSPSSAPISC